MKLILLSLFISSWALAKPTVLVSYFDPFGRATVNNSETVAKLLALKALQKEVNFDISLCKLETKFDISYEQLKACLRTLPEEPVLIIGLGETGCSMKLELAGRNLDRTYGPDNAGQTRRNTPIVRNGPPALGLSYPLQDMYCAIPANERKNVIVSNNAGSFVCNNIAYQISYYEDDLVAGFIHVPDHSCRNLPEKNEKVSDQLLAMITEGVRTITETVIISRLPVSKNEMSVLQDQFDKDECKYEFYQRARTYKPGSFWDILN